MIRRHRRTLVAVALAGALAALVATLPQRTIYQAHASLEVQGLNGDFMNMRQVDPNSSTPNYISSDAYVQTQARILQSESLVKRALARMEQSGRLFAEPESAWWMLKSLVGWEDRSLNPIQRTGKRIAESLTVRGAAGQTRIVEIRAEAFRPQIAADFVNTLVAEYMAQDLSARLNSTTETREWMIQQMEEMRAKLQNSEDRLQAYARQTGLLFTSEKDPIAEEKLRLIEHQLTSAQNDAIVAKTHAERAAASSPDSLPDVLVDRTIRDGRRKLLELKTRLVESNLDHRGEAAAAGLQAQIATVEAAIQQQVQDILERIRRDNEEASRRAKVLDGAYASQARVVIEHSEKAVQYNILKREVDANRQLYEGILQKVKEAGIASAMRSSTIRIIDSAEPPKKPYQPSWSQNITIGLLSGILLGLVYAVTREHVDRRLHKPGDAATYLNLPELGVIPCAETRVGRRLPGRLLALNGNGTGVATEVLSAPAFAGTRDDASTSYSLLLSEAFRSMLLSIVYSGNSLDSQRVLVVTEANPLDGSTTVSANLAISFAGINRKVLLIDGNLRKPRLHEMFGVTNQTGLRDLLQNSALVDAADHAVIQSTQVRNLFVLASGSESSEASVLLHADRVRSLIEHFRGRFETIIVDTPPLPQFPDARVFGRAADSVILVARAGQTTRDALGAARDRLAEDGTRILGAVLNDWDPRLSPAG